MRLDEVSWGEGREGSGQLLLLLQEVDTKGAAWRREETWRERCVEARRRLSGEGAVHCQPLLGDQVR